MIATIAKTFKDGLLTKGFYIGFGLTVLFYIILLTWALLGSSSYLEDLNQKLASETIPVQREADIVQAQLTQKDEQLTPEKPTPQVTETYKPNVERQAGAIEPIDGLYETTAQGALIPIIRKSDNLTPFQAYKAPFEAKADHSLIAIVIDNFGLSENLSEIKADLPPSITFVLTPYAPDVDKTAKSLAAMGQEIWIDLPFETQNFPNQDPGPKGILKRSSLQTNQDNLRWVLQQSEIYTGIAAFTDNVFGNANPVTNTIAREVFGRGLGFFSKNASSTNSIQDIALRQNADFVKNDLFIDENKLNQNLEETLDLLENIALSRGSAIAVIPPYPELAESIKNWSQNLGAKNIQLAPLSAILIKRSSSNL